MCSGRRKCVECSRKNERHSTARWGEADSDVTRVGDLLKDAGEGQPW